MEPWFVSRFNCADSLKEWGYRAQIPRIYAACAVTWDKHRPRTFPKGSKERFWVDSLAAKYDTIITAAKKQGLEVYPFTDFLVLPENLVKKYAVELGVATMHSGSLEDSLTQGRIIPDLSKPFTQKLIRECIAEIFDRFPQIDGLTTRTGEIYLQDCPHHTGGNLIQGRLENHIILANLLRDEVCVKRGKKVLYRTWDFGLLHTNEENFLRLSAALEPHPLFIFSIKHQKGDYHRNTVFNPTINKGKHRFQVEVQCQMEAYGKGAHPYYVANGVIEGWEEYRYLQPDYPYKGLRSLSGSPRFVGVWTWSRGGGWRGPYIGNELWPALNAYVISHWAQDTTRSEESLFNEFAHRYLGLDRKNTEIFRRLAMLSAEGVLKGQLSQYYPALNHWWTRDEFLGGIQQLEKDFSYIIGNGLVAKVLAEKREASAIWQQIEALARQLEMPSREQAEFIMTTATYGRVKYAIIEQAWIVMLKGMQGDRSGRYEIAAIRGAIDQYDFLWNEWNNLKAMNADCPTLYVDEYFMGDVPGMGASIDKYRNLR
ncbi:hypothetical protein L0U88_03505 [Flavihumibacter sp. RY-1]|uniref:Uncharacterized protein n=1 Tax=Flavihumibacter fluminis TaxID=2909236 RepID=A0ABS9BEF6_9BACT|nr:hypothetical protein [Flavihumibacter fluminis]MCF1713695.1 hypothetical protein [Flavihumibacter fluminis]